MISARRAHGLDARTLTATGRSRDRDLETVIGPLLDPGYRLAFLMLNDREGAEDAVQNAALKCWRKASQLRAGSDPLPWFLGFVANECRNLRRSKWRSVIKLGDREDIEESGGRPGPDPDVRRGLERLRPGDRLLVLLHFYLDMPVEDMAAVAGLGAGAARSRLYRALKELKRYLQVDGKTT